MDLILGRNKFGKAVFAGRPFKRGESIIEWKGPVLSGTELPKVIIGGNDRFTQIDDDKYIGGSGELDDIFNHSCDPNAGLLFGDKIFLIAIEDIVKGDEICWDYSTTIGDGWQMECMCGSSRCRNIISNFKFLPKEIQNKYIDLGIVPKYLLNS